MSEKTARNVMEEQSIPVRCVDTGESFASIRQASKALGVPYSAVRRAALCSRRTAGGLRFELLDDGEGRPSEGTPGGQRVPVRCLETGEVFASVADAARALGTKGPSVSAVMAQGRAYRGLHFKKEPSCRGPFAAPGRSKAARRAAPLQRRRSTPCECVETGELFPSAACAARAVGVASKRVLDVLDREGLAAAGLHFARRPGATGPFADPAESRARALASRGGGRPGHPVRCVETGEEWPSVSAAARSLGVAPGSVDSVLDRPGRTTCGLHFESVE